MFLILRFTVLKREGLSSVIADAVACGVPRVVTDFGDPSWVGGNFGEVVPRKEAVARKNTVEECSNSVPTLPLEFANIVDRLSVDSLIQDKERTPFKLVHSSDTVNVHSCLPCGYSHNTNAIYSHSSPN
jgi:glycosyltransferase involved in cell wall biosynthesis